ncbi:hypothetical protein [Clostridium sulfidigenes]
MAVAWMLQYVVDVATGSSLQFFFRSVMLFSFWKYDRDISVQIK